MSSRFIYSQANLYFCLINRFSTFCKVFLFPIISLFFFQLGKQAASISRYTHCYSDKLEFLSTLSSSNSPSLFGAYQIISLLYFPNSATTILYHSSLALRFSSALWWYDLFKLKLDWSIRSLSDFCLIITKISLHTGLQIYILLFLRFWFIHLEFPSAYYIVRM